VHEGEQGRVQRHPPGRQRVGRGIPVHGVADHRVAEVGEVDPHLVGAPGAQFRLDQRRAREPLERPDDGVGGPAAGARRERRATRPRSRAADPARHDHLSGQIPAHEGQVPALDGVGAELGLQPLDRLRGEAQNQHPGGVAVETVDDEHAAVTAGAALQFGGGAGEHGVAVALVGRVNQHARRLVDHHDLGVKVEEHDRGRPVRSCQTGAIGVVRHRVFLVDQRAGVGDDGAVDQHVPEHHFPFGVGVRGAHHLLRRTSEPARCRTHSRRVTPQREAMWTAARVPG
jgi:hypothetical protein